MRPARLSIVLGTAFLAALWLVSTPAAEAHAVLVRADPPVNSQLREPPSSFSLYFSEALERKVSTARVVDADRKRVDTGVEFDDADDALMRIKLGQLEPGYYLVIWETLSKVDGHRITGQYPITVLRPDGSLPPGTNPSAAGQTATVSGVEAKPDRVVTKWALLLAGSVVTGGLAFAWVVRGMSGIAADEARAAAGTRIMAAAAIGLWVLAVAGFADLLLQADSVFGSIWKFPDVISGTRWGERWLVRNALVPPLALGLVAYYRQGTERRAGRWLLTFLVGLAAAYLAIQATVSHAAAGGGSFWATASDFVHLLAASVWIGMLVQVVLLARWSGRALPREDRPAVLASALRRFSLLAVLSVSLLLFTGVANAAIELTAFNDLFDTGYGRALLIKLLLVLPLLAAGALNAYLFRPQVAEIAGRPDGASPAGWAVLERSLSRTVRVEAGLAVLVLLVVGVLVQLAPSRTALAAPASGAGKFTETRQADDVTVTLNIDPNQPGLNTFETYLTGGADAVERVRLIFEEQKKDAFQADLILDASNRPVFFVGRGPFLNEAGKWKITVELRRSRGNDLLVPFVVQTAAPGGAASASSRGSAFDAPGSFSPSTIALIAVAGVLCLAMVVVSLDTPGRPAGLMGDWADWAASLQVKPAFSLAILVVVGVGLGILFGTHTHDILPSKQARQGNPVESSPKSVEKGRQLFMQNCIQCHGETGRGDGPLAASLPIKPANLYDHVPYHPDQFFFNIISNGLSGVMPAFGSQISEEDRWNILNFLRDQFGQGAASQ